MMDQRHSPLTKEYLTAALFELEERLDSRLRLFATKEDIKQLATKEDMEQRFATKDALRTVQAAVARLEGDMHDVKHILRTQVATKRDLEPILRFADRALKEMDEHRELRSTRGALLSDVTEKVEDHERRLRGLEGRS